MATTSAAADIIGVKYETLRNWLKRGLLDSAQDSTRLWRRFSDVDLCCLQLMKEGLAVGISTETMLDVCQDHDVRSSFGRLCADTGRPAFWEPPLVLIWPAGADALFMLAPGHAVPHELAANPAPVVILDLTYMHSLVAVRLVARA